MHSLASTVPSECGKTTLKPSNSLRVCKPVREGTGGTGGGDDVARNEATATLEQAENT